jgi:hypothetical protein
MVHPFSRRPASSQYWQERARALQAKLEGLSIAQLMRGPIDADGSAGLDPNYNPNQPRIPAGHHHGGRWTSASRSNAHAVSVGPAAAGHDTQTLAARATRVGFSASGNSSTMQGVSLTFPSTLPPGVVLDPAPPEILLNKMDRDTTIYSKTKPPDVAGPMTGTFTKVADGFEVTDGTFGIIARNLATGRIEGAIVAVPRGVTARAIMLPNGNIHVSFSTGI